jgi:hypothetical protein
VPGAFPIDLRRLKARPLLLFKTSAERGSQEVSNNLVALASFNAVLNAAFIVRAMERCLLLQLLIALLRGALSRGRDSFLPRLRRLAW